MTSVVNGSSGTVLSKYNKTLKYHAKPKRNGMEGTIMIERTNERTNNRNATNPIGNAAETKCNVTQHIECKRKRNESNPQRNNTYNFMKFHEI